MNNQRNWDAEVVATVQDQTKEERSLFRELCQRHGFSFSFDDYETSFKKRLVDSKEKLKESKHATT